MDELLQDVLYPVMLGANTACHAAVRQLQKRFGTDCVVLTGKRALTLRFTLCYFLLFFGVILLHFNI